MLLGWFHPLTGEVVALPRVALGLEGGPWPLVGGLFRVLCLGRFSMSFSNCLGGGYILKS
jgi:hypothetical protein